jgi:hypothetical protein
VLQPGLNICPNLFPKFWFAVVDVTTPSSWQSCLQHCHDDGVEHYGLDGDMLEAQAFAYLGARVRNKLPTSGPSTTGAPVFVGGGELAR